MALTQKKVLFIITKAVWGGAQRYVFDLATHLPKNTFAPVVVTSMKGPLIEKLKRNQIRVIPLSSLERDVRFFSDCATFFRLCMIFFREKPSVIHLNSSKIGAIGALAAWLYNALKSLFAGGGSASGGKAKVVFTAHGWAWNEERPWWQKKMIVAITRFSAVFQDTIIVLSHYDMSSALSHGIPHKKLVAIPLGIQPTSFLNPMDAKQALAEILHAPLTRPLFGTVAELTKNKGLPYLIQAMHGVHQHVPGSCCVIIGNGKEEAALKNMAEENGLAQTIFFAGFLENASCYLKAFDFFVLPSIKEGLPYVLLEALQAGIPIIASLVGGIPDLVENNVNGILVAPRNPTELSQAMIRLGTSLKTSSEFSQNALKKNKAFSFEKMLGQTIQLYKS